MIALTNSLGSNPHQVVDQAYKLVLPELIKATTEAKADAHPVWRKYVGDYESEWVTQKVVIRDGQLQLIYLDDIDGKPAVLEPTDDETVFVLQQSGQSNETLRFELDEAGKVVKLWERNEYSKRMD